MAGLKERMGSKEIGRRGMREREERDEREGGER